MDEMHPLVLTVLDSVGRRVRPQVSTSAAAPDAAELMRVRTNLNADALVQAPEVDGKLTFNAMPGGRIGAEALKGVARRALVTVVLREAYTRAAVVLEEVLDSVVYETWLPELPENAMAGMPSLTASHAAPL